MGSHSEPLAAIYHIYHTNFLYMSQYLSIYITMHSHIYYNLLD